MQGLVDTRLPRPQILHLYPVQRLCNNHPRQELDERNFLRLDLCGGTRRGCPYRDEVALICPIGVHYVDLAVAGGS